MALPQTLRSRSNTSKAQLEEVARLLMCSPDRFFDPTPKIAADHTAELIEMWSAIRSDEGRHVVLLCAEMVLQAQLR